jgi:hypothetical protein
LQVCNIETLFYRANLFFPQKTSLGGQIYQESGGGLLAWTLKGGKRGCLVADKL